MFSARTKIWLILVLIALTVWLSISGCATVRGIASDIKVVAGALEESLEPMDQSQK